MGVETGEKIELFGSGGLKKGREERVLALPGIFLGNFGSTKDREKESGYFFSRETGLLPKGEDEKKPYFLLMVAVVRVCDLLIASVWNNSKEKRE